MKKIIFTFFLAAGTFMVVSSQPTLGTEQVAPATEKLEFEKKNHDFGKIKQGVPVTYIFKFTNKGSKDVLLQNVQASCGCTTPQWPKEPIKPGDVASITVTYNAAAIGMFTKQITVSTHGGTIETLNITGEVIVEPTDKPNVPEVELKK